MTTPEDLKAAEIPRKVIQISAAAYQGCGLFALCNDGTIFELYNPTDCQSEWKELKAIPQPITLPEGEI